MNFVSTFINEFSKYITNNDIKLYNSNNTKRKYFDSKVDIIPNKGITYVILLRNDEIKSKFVFFTQLYVYFYYNTVQYKYCCHTFIYSYMLYILLYM